MLISCSFQEVAVGIVVKKTIKAIKKYNVKQLLIAGGVSANSYLRKYLKEECDSLNVEILMPPIKYCTDNAAMIASAGYYAYKKGIKADYSLSPEPGLDL